MRSQEPSQEILTSYFPALTGLIWSPVEEGFSGAEVWRGDDSTGNPAFALKRLPAELDPTRLTAIHRWMTQAAHLTFVPSILRTTSGDTFVYTRGRCWEITRWMPGKPVSDPTTADVGSACAAVAKLHAAWPIVHTSTCPGVLNRLRATQDFRRQFGTHQPPQISLTMALIPLVRRAWSAVVAHLERTESMLRPWERLPLPLRPCVRDLRAEHVLFSEQQVAGIIDYGAMAVDHPAVDLARLLGDYGCLDEPRYSEAIRAYQCESQSGALIELIRILAHSGTVCSLIGWLLRLVTQQQTLPAEYRIVDRMTLLLERLDRFAPE